MDDKQINYETIERYLSGELPLEEATQFEKRLAKDPDLRLEVELHQELQASISDKDADKVEQQIKMIGREFASASHPKVAKTRPLWKRSWAIAASLLFLIALSFLIKFYSSAALSTDELYLAHYETPELLTISRSDENTVPADLVSAYQAYEAKNYEAAILNFSAQASKENLDIIDQFYYAISYLAQPDSSPDQTITLLKPIIDHGDNAYADAARWYTALALLKKGTVDQAKVFLEKIQAEGSGKYKAKSKGLLEDLE